MSKKIKVEFNEAISIIETLMQYGNIHPVEGVRYPAGSHKEFLEQAQQWLSRNRLIDNLESSESIQPETADDVDRIISDILCADKPYPLTDILERLIFASEYLLNEKSYDAHNYEEITECVKQAKIIKESVAKINIAGYNKQKSHRFSESDKNPISEFLNNWNKANNPFYPDAMKWDISKAFDLLVDYTSFLKSKDEK